MQTNEMLQNENSAAINLIASESIRSGVYVNISSIRTTPKEVILEFAFVDSERDDGDKHVMEGVLQSRIIMSHTSLLELQTMLNSHIESNFQKAE